MDNSIVVLENITRLVARGMTRTQAALEGVREVWPAVLASTLTTVMVFLPVVFLKLEAGQLYSDIAIGISAMILMSMIVAITMIPAAASRFLTHREVPAGHAKGIGGALVRAGISFGAKLIGFMDWLLDTRGRRIGALVATAVVALFIMLAMTPKAEYLPEGEEAKVFARMFAPPGYNLQTMLDIHQQLDPIATSQIDADGSDFAAGRTDIPPIHRHVSFLSPGFMMFVTLPTERQDTQALVDGLTRHFQSIPGMFSFASRGSIFSDNRGGSRSINVELNGRNLEDLYETALATYQAAEALFDGGQVNSSPSPTTLAMSQPIARILPDWERAAELGLDQSQLGYMMWAYSDGAFVDEFFLDDDKIDMYLYSSTGVVNQPQDLENVMVHTPNGTVQLSALARVEEVVGTSSVQRVNGLRTVTINIIPPRNVALESGVEIVQRDLIRNLRDSGVIPLEITAEISGASTKLEDTRAEMGANFILAIFIAYLLMVAVFSHWGFPLIIMTTVPIGISGGLVGLWLVNAIGSNLDLIGLNPVLQPFDVITMLGFLVLIGTVVNNPILIVERAVRNVEQKGMAIVEAVKEAAHVRLRPVMMSTVTTVCGLSPSGIPAWRGRRALPWTRGDRVIRPVVLQLYHPDDPAGIRCHGARGGSSLQTDRGRAGSNRLLRFIPDSSSRKPGVTGLDESSAFEHFQPGK